MKRVVGYLLAGLGALLAVLAPMLAFYVKSQLLVTPIDQYAQSFAPGVGSYLDSGTLTEVTGANLVAHRVLRGDVGASSATVGVWDQFLSITNTDTSALVQSYTDRVAWDRKTALAVNCCDENVNGQSVQHVGLSYKFPFNARKATYPFFDTTALKAYDMGYQRTETVQGLSTYVYVQDIAPLQIQTLAVPGSLVGQPGVASVAAPVFYKNVRTVWVEPQTGVIVKGSEQQFVTLRTATGADATKVLDVTVTFDDRTQQQQAALAKDSIRKLTLIGTLLPIGCLILAAAALVGAFLLLRRRPSTPEPAPEPTHASLS